MTYNDINGHLICSNDLEISSFFFNQENLQEKMHVSLFVKISSFWRDLSLKVGKKAKNTRCGHLHDTTALFLFSSRGSFVIVIL